MKEGRSLAESLVYKKKEKTRTKMTQKSNTIKNHPSLNNGRKEKRNAETEWQSKANT